jgi:mannosyl-3-phosphoglycerate phosphatase
MSNQSRSIYPVVFSDLDGSLLDHHSYDYSPAIPGMQRLENADIPLVLTTSKTRAEVIEHVQDMGLNHPFVIENGGAVCIPAGYFEAASSDSPLQVIALAPEIDEFAPMLDEARAQHGMKFRALTEMDVGDIVAYTGLPPEQAVLAGQREFTLPLVWEDTQEQLKLFEQMVEKARLVLRQGGRFIHLQGETDKSIAMQDLVRRYEKFSGLQVISIALGDSGNDRGMLESASYAVVIPGAGGMMKLERGERVHYSSQQGPAGWNEGLNAVLDELNQEYRTNE